MKYIVKRRDSLIKIATNIMGDKTRWRELALINSLSTPYKIYIGQELQLPANQKKSSTADQQVLSPSQTMLGAYSESNMMYARAFFFLLADEVLPSGKVVRKVIQYPNTMQQMILAHPEKYGMRPPNPAATISLGEHALGANNSQYLSASTRPKGAPNFTGRPVYIDVAKAKKAGAIIHSTEDIIADLNRLKAKQPSLAPRVELLKDVIINVEREVLIQGEVPGTAIKSGKAMNVTRGLRVVQFVGFAITVYDLGAATHKSIETESAKPIIAEGIRQVGGWGGAIAGLKIGGLAGVAVGIETGPGALVTGAIGAIIFGAGGYFGADWVADFIDEN